MYEFASFSQRKVALFLCCIGKWDLLSSYEYVGGETEVMVSFSFPLISRPGDTKCFALSSGVITYIIFFAKSTPVPFIPLSRLREKVLRAKVGKET